jgi:Zn-dependent protease
MRPSPIFAAIVAIVVGAGVATGRLSVGEALTGGARLWPVLLVVGGWVVSLCLHEYAHAVVAYAAGDRSVAARGYLTLDPRRYADPVFSLILPIVFLLSAGIGLPGGAVLIDHRAIRSRWARSAVALAGPAVNVLLGLGLMALVRSGALDGSPTVAACLAYLAVLQLATAALNLLPVPGLDGWGAIEPHLPGAFARAMAPFRGIAVILLLLVLLATDLGAAIVRVALDVATAMHVAPDLVVLGAYLADMRIL